VKINKKLVAALITIILSFAFGRAVEANTDEWRFELTPYFWASEADIDAATINGQTSSAELDFDDILDLLDFAGFARFEAWKGKWGFIADVSYVDLGADGTLTPQLGPLTFPEISVDVDFRQTTLDFGASRRFEISSGSTESKWWFDLMGGIRYSYLKQEIDVSKAPGPFVSAFGTTLGGDEDWFEPFVGARIGWQLTDNLILAVRADVGGFGIGDASDLTWNIVLGIEYKPWEKISIKAGYRIYDIDYETGSGGDRFGYDAQLRGPALGVTFHF
jgi:hypothetical protein